MNKSIFVSKIGFSTFIIFSILLFFMLLLIPLGDEPDFLYRIFEIAEKDHLWFSPYSFLSNYVKDPTWTRICVVDASSFSLWAHLKDKCSVDLNLIFVRYIFSIFVISPLFYSIIFRKSFSTIISLIFRFSQKKSNWNESFNVLSISLLYPIMVYHLSLAAEEQLTLIISLFIFLLFDYKIASLLLMYLISLIDIGNTIVVFLFFCFAHLFVFLVSNRNFKIKHLLILVLSILSLGYLIGNLILPYIQNIGIITSKVTSLVTSLEGSDIGSKYPLILRPIITFMTGVFSLPSGLRVVILFPLYGFLLVQLIFRVMKRLNLLSEENTEENTIFRKKTAQLLAAATTVIFMIFILPGYANIKYYIFLLPFLIQVAIYTFNYKNIILVFVLTNFVIFLHLLLFRL